MRLKSLRLKGFKSFADDTLINFDDNLIGVVGPNGSGKSNIVDAIRWVLGEGKSKELRLEKMGDVIFNGTKKRKTSSVAHVTMEFDNTKNLIPIDYNTVSISRLLYRNGDSEYRLNNVSCRKRDITDLFLNSGIGSNSYAIIALGMVDDLLANKDHSRRKMFEQAAGISKFKTRKKETESKLRSTQADLERLEDILFELESNMKSLEKQAKRAAKFLELKKEYREKAIIYSKFKISDIHEKFKLKKSQITAEEDVYRQKNTQFHTLEAELENFKKENIEKELIVSTHQKELNTLFDNIRRLENQKDLNKEKISFNTTNKISLSKSVEERTNRSGELGEKAKKQQSYLSETVTEFDQFKKSFETADLEYKEIKERFDSKREELNKSQKIKLELEEKRNAFEKDLAIEQNNLTVAEQNALAIAENLSKQKTVLAELDAAVKKAIDSENELSNQYKVRLEDIELLKSDIRNKEQKLESRRLELSELKRKLDQSISQRDLLKSMIESLEGFPDSIKYLKKKWNTKLNMLADILDCEEKYKQAVEQYFEPFLNHFVVDTVEEGLEGIKTLRSSQRGKASFYILGSIPQTAVKSTEIKKEWIPLLSAIKVKPKYQKLMDFLCMDCYIIEGEAGLIGQKTNATLISANGSFVRTSGEIKGGSIGLFEGKKLGRKKAYEKTLVEITKLESALKDKEKEIETIQSEDLKTKLIAKETELKTFLVTLSTARNARAKSETEYLIKKEAHVELEEKAETFAAQVEQSNTILSKLTASLKEVLERLQKGIDDPQESEGFLSQLESELSLKSKVFNEAQIDLIKLEGKLAAAKSELEFTTNQVNENQTFLKSEEEKLAQSIEIIKQANEVISTLEVELQSLYETKETKQSSLNQEEQSYYKIKNEIGEKEKVIRQLNRELQQLQISINKNKEKFHSLELELNSIEERLKIEFDLTLEELEKTEVVVDEEIDYSELESRVKSLRTKLNNYGEVNPMAVITFNEIKERYDDIIVQRQDIFDAKESLIQTILEIETEAVQKFSEAFNKISANFSDVFRSLFSDDDDCDLVLMNPDDPLESDIEIIAKPKGKRPKSLSQLSGGEKTLTATALLFSLYLLKPAPFCIFDEVDAPLDDANILKFSRLITKFSKDSQFILITHNKATMAAVNILYGVYMQEQGVSGIAPVDFRNYEYNPTLQVVNN